MRKKILIPCLIVLAICLLLVFLKTKQHSKIAAPIAEAPATNQQVQTQKPKIVEQHRVTNFLQLASAFVPNPSPQAQVVAKTNPMAGLILGLWQGHIDFYGKVVDESNNPVAGATVNFNWVEAPSENGNRKAATTSDSNGFFSLRDKLGLELGVSVSKDGYYSSRRNNDSFNFGPIRGKSFQPDPLNPVVFYLRKKGQGADLIQKDFPPLFTQIWQLHHDGTPIELDLLNGSQNVTGTGQLKLELHRDLSDRNARKFDWNLQISVLDGGIIPTDEEFAFEAPESGYQPSIVIDMPATNQDWLGELRTKYYLQLPNGNYGRIDFYFQAYNGVFTVKSWVNPTGSRNLEPAN